MPTPVIAERQHEPAGLRVVDGIDVLVKGRPSEVASTDDELGENSPNLVPVATVIDHCGGCHVDSPESLIPAEYPDDQH